MSWLARRRLDAIVRRRRSIHADLAIADAQLVELAADADDLETRAVLDERGGMDAREARAARRHHDTLRRHRDRLRTQLDELAAEQDRLLDRLPGRSRSGDGC